MFAGAFGTVYKALLDGVDKVAVKMLAPGVVKQNVLSAFCNEVQAASCTTDTLPVLLACICFTACLQMVSAARFVAWPARAD